MGKRKSTDCLWNWEDVHGVTIDRICYNRESHYFHMCCRKVCKSFETRPVIPNSNGRKTEIWGRNSYGKPHWKGGTTK